MKNKTIYWCIVMPIVLFLTALDFIKEEWPAILASLAFGALMTVAVELVINNWDHIKYTLK